MSHLDITSMFLLGLFGAGHCVGMCGPLVLVFPAGAGRFSAHLFYHSGRLATYAAAGMVMGGIGAGISRLARNSGVAPLAWIARIQVGFSIAAAVFLLIFGLSRLGFFAEPAWMGTAKPSKIPGLRGVIGSVLKTKSNASMGLLGLMMGFLPCGLSYAAFSRALAAGGTIRGGMLAAAFGAGTLPALMIFGTGFSRIGIKYRHYSDLVSGMIMIAMAGSLFADAGGAVSDLFAVLFA